MIPAGPWWLEAIQDFACIVDDVGNILAANSIARPAIESVNVTSLEEFRQITMPGGEFPDPVEVITELAATGRWKGTVRLGINGMVFEALDVLFMVGPDNERVVVSRDRREQTARIEAEEQRAATEEYLARLGHELRTPLNAVLGFAQLLDLEPLQGSQREAVDHILTGGRHMATLLDDVLDLARVRGGGVDLDVGAVPVLDVVRGVVDLVAPLANRRSIKRFVEPATPAVALADRTRLWQVLLNLVSNAVKYGRDGGMLRVGVTVTDDGKTRIEVEDDGPGLVADEMDRIFRPFDRLGAERSGVEGTGLGLALAQALVQAMDGQLLVDSQPGRGTTMIVELSTVDADGIIEVADEVVHPRRTVLHVGGDEGNRALLSQVVRTRLRGNPVAITRSDLAPEAVRRNQPAVVVISDDLPDGTAVELVHKLGANPLTALVPIVVLSQEAVDLRVRIRMRAAGAAAVLSVPIDMRELLDVLGRFLDQAASTT